MKKLVSIIAAIVMSASLAQAYPSIVEAQRGPESPIALQNGVIQVVTSLHLPCGGKWTISGGSTVQANVSHPEWGYYSGTIIPYAFLYTFAGFSLDPNQMPYDGTANPDARPYGTWWFSASPRTHTIRVNQETDVFLVVMYFGQIPADYVQTFGSMIATLDLYD